MGKCANQECDMPERYRPDTGPCQSRVYGKCGYATTFGHTASCTRYQPTEPPCEHRVARGCDINDGLDFPFKADEVLCDDCGIPMIVRPAAQWADVEKLPGEWEESDEVPEPGYAASPDYYGGYGAAACDCAAELRKALGLPKEEGDDG